MFELFDEQSLIHNCLFFTVQNTVKSQVLTCVFNIEITITENKHQISPS